MRFIAHRILRDGERLDSLDPRRVRGFDGAELDLRLDAAGSLTVRHAPLILAGGAPRKLRGHCFDEVLRALTSLPEAPRLLLLDVKCETAARAAALTIARRPPAAEIVFACWHEGEVAAIRETLPEAKILFCVAPIVSQRAGRRAAAGRAARRIDDLYLCNSFPFFWSAQNFTPRLEKHNRHNINIKLVAPGHGISALPAGVDGLCLHRLFWNPALAALAASEGLTVALYGLGSRAQARREAAHGGYDYAIISAKGRESHAASETRVATAPDAGAAA
ncbi:hypothetical protein [Rubrimonas cliftonensis]|uniref:Uncharacterized protein n=1 Tax=Rubrimonas cliftonensis TaxID=89524 RepID=A0A1H4B4F1_9RHOB|nr:hypothetical protein [Rubrimonas cliftonensis]SEA42969.1 hypothetical protein SAMN05444370_10516 [Rubrimonas cliftonensis]